MAFRKINKLEMIILKTVYGSKGKAGSYALYKKIKTPLSELMKAVFSLQDSGYLSIDGDWLNITDIGIKHLYEFRNDRKGLECRVPVEMKRTFQIKPGDPYIPSRCRLHFRVFANKNV